MPGKKKKTAPKIDPVRSLRKFMIDEDGFVSKETILKVGFTAAAAVVAGAGMATDAHAKKGQSECYKYSYVTDGLEHKNHSNAVMPTADAGGTGVNCFQHHNSLQHTSY